MVEEGIRGFSPSSSEISLPAKPPTPHQQHAQTSRLPTLNVTHTNIESHHKTPANRPRNTNQNSKQPSEHKQKTRTFTTKKILQHSY